MKLSPKVVAGLVVAPALAYVVMYGARLSPGSDVNAEVGTELDPRPVLAAAVGGHGGDGAADDARGTAQLRLELAALRKRLTELERRGDGTTKASRGRDQDEQGQQADRESMSDRPDRPEAPSITETEFAAWMTDRIRSSEWDAKRTERVADELNETMHILPESSVEEVECGSRFCRASLYRADGDYPDANKLIGAPPFVGEAYSILESDGHVSLYFGAEGVRLGDFRAEALLDVENGG